MVSFSHSIFARLLRRLAQAVCRHPRRFLYPQFILAAVCLLYAGRRLQFDMNRDDLVGPNSRREQIYLHYEKEFPGGDDMVALIESGSPERSRAFIEALADQIRPETNLFEGLFYKADLTTLGPKALLLFPTNALVEMRQALGQYRPMIQQFAPATNLDSLFARVNARFRNAGSGKNDPGPALTNAIPFLQQLVTEARQSLASSATPPPPGLSSLMGGGPQAAQQSYLTFDHGRIFLLSVRPRTEALTSAAIKQLRHVLGVIRTEVPGVDAGLTGGPVLDYDEMRESEHDSIVASIAAFILCSLIFIVGYREVGRPLKTAACLLIGMSYTLGFTTLAVGHLNILTITFAPMLIGLAVDFGVHFITRYEEEMRNRRSVDEATERAMALTGQGIVTGALTTGAAFLAMALTHFKGIREMGIISGGGLLLCLAPMMTALPALLRKGRQNRLDHQIGAAGQARLRIENVWLKHPRLVVGTTLALCAGAAFQFPRVHFDYNLLHLQNPRLRSVIYARRMLHLADRSVLFAAVLANSLPQAREYAERLKALPLVATVDSVAGYLDDGQQRKLELARSVKREVTGIHFAPADRRPVNLKALSATLWYLSGYLGLAAKAAHSDAPGLAAQFRSLRQAIARFSRAMHDGRAGIRRRLTTFQQAFFAGFHRSFDAIEHQDTTGPLRPRDLPPALRSRFIGVTGQYLLQVYPKRNLWRHRNQRAFLRQLQSAVPAQRVTGTPSQLYEYTTLLKLSYEQAALYSIGAIVLMVLAHFRSLPAVGLSLLPVAIGATWLLGFMGLAGVSFNPANIMTLPLVVGIGVTNGIQILNRFAEERQAGILAKSTGKAVLVSGLTALSGFGSLMLAQHPGIRSLGEVMAVGIAACMVAALTFLPALLRILLHRKWRILES